MTTKELTEEIKTINVKLDELKFLIDSADNTLRAYSGMLRDCNVKIKALMKDEEVLSKDVDMLKRWRG